MLSVHTSAYEAASQVWLLVATGSYPVTSCCSDSQDPPACQLLHMPLHQPAPSCRYVYPRHNASDGMVVPYHPAVLLAWGAHVNIQRVTNTSWSFYILKYAGAQHV